MPPPHLLALLLLVPAQGSPPPAPVATKAPVPGTSGTTPPPAIAPPPAKPRVAALPQIALPDDPLAAIATETEVAFKAPDGAELAGTLAMPPGARRRVPVILLCPPGAMEDFDRDASFNGNLRLYRQIAQRLAAHGVASLRYDRRGIGRSKGSLDGVTVAALGGDVAAALVFLRGQPAVDAKQILVLAHGVGVPMMLEGIDRDQRLAGVVLVAATSLAGDQAIMENYRGLVAAWPDTSDKKRAEAIAEHQAIIDTVRTGQGMNRLSPKVYAQVSTPYFKSLLAFDPAPYYRRLHAPVLLVHGQKDRQVSADHIHKVRALLERGGNHRVTTVLDPYINHILANCETGYVTEYAALGNKADPETVERIALWVAELVGTEAKKPSKR